MLSVCARVKSGHSSIYIFKPTCVVVAFAIFVRVCYVSHNCALI